MKSRIFLVAMAAICAIGMISCGNPAEPEEFILTAENVDEYVISLADCEGVSVEATKEDLTDELVEYYADFYYTELAKKTEGMSDAEGNAIPMTDDAIKMLDSEVFKTVNEFMVFVRNTVDDYLVYSYENEIVENAISEVVAASEFADIPLGFLEAEKGIIYNRYSETAQSYDIDVDYYLELCGTPTDTLAEDYAKTDLVYMKIAKERGIDTADTEEMKKKVSEYILSVTDVK